MGINVAISTAFLCKAWIGVADEPRVLLIDVLKGELPASKPDRGGVAPTGLWANAERNSGGKGHSPDHSAICPQISEAA